jgi:hypothetical protein
MPAPAPVTDPVTPPVPMPATADAPAATAAQALTAMSGFSEAAGREVRARRGLRGVARIVLRMAPPALILGLSMSSLPGCVLPLAPQFSDPPSQENFAPVITDSRPLEGMIVTSTTFSITVTDPNVTDDLWVRWIGEYPPFSNDSQRLLSTDQHISHSVDGTPLQSTQSITLNCLYPLDRQLTQHPIMALVSDRAFLPADSDAGLETILTGISPGAKKAEAHWVLDLDCSSSP